MSNGQGCTCNAWSANECACGADWTPQEVYDLRAENERLKAELKSIDGALDDPRANLTLTTAEIIWEIKAELAACREDAGRYREWKYRFREGECELFNALADCATDEEHNAAIDAAMKGK